MPALAVELLAKKSGFQPTPSSLPPSTVLPRLDAPLPTPNAHSSHPSGPSLDVNRTPLNPLQFLLRAAIICPDKLAVAHVERGCYYSYGVLSVFTTLLLVTPWLIDTELMSMIEFVFVDILVLNVYRTSRTP